MRYGAILRLTVGFVAWVMMSACTSQDKTSAAIADSLRASEGKWVDLAQAVPGDWERVCFLGPYSENTIARKTLGFDWNAAWKTAIQENEGITLLLFVRGNEVLNYVEHPRSKGDFTNLSEQCFVQRDAVFIQDSKPGRGWPGLFHKEGT